jgi:hypothetical protein
MININIKLFLLSITLVFFLILRFQGGSLKQSYAPIGIVSMEFAYTGEKAATVAEGWKADGLKHKANQNVLIDFLFIPCYALLFYTLAGSISVRLNNKAATLGVLLAFFSLIAGALDVLENILMLASINLFYSDLTAMATAAFAALKFLLLALALLYIVAFGIGVVIRGKQTSIPL